MSRRRLLSAGAGMAAAGLLLPKAALAAMPGERRVAFYNTHTGESIKTTYWQDGAYVPEGLAEVNNVLRDFRTGDVHAMDPALIDLLVRARALTDGGDKAIHIISGYRSPKTNAMLNGKSAHSGVAKKSMHMEGKAIDIRVPGVQLDYLRKAALSLKAGGVGYYPESNFVHMDTGRVRFW